MNQLKKIVLFITILTSILAVSPPALGVIHLVALGLFGAFSFIFFPVSRLNKNTLAYLFRYLLPFLIALFVSLPINYVFNGDYDYTKLTPLGRIVNLLVLSVIMLQMDRMYKDGVVSFRSVLRCYFAANLLMMLSALWQALDFYTGFPISFPLETRSFLHSASSSYSIGMRITGVGQEPSYLASFILDYLIVSLFLLRGKVSRMVFIGLGLVIAFLTFSPSAYISVLVLLIVFIAYKRKAVNYYVLLTPIMAISVVIVLAYIDFSEVDSIQYFIDRIATASDSGRFQVIFKAVDSIVSQQNAFVFLFGNGLKSFQLLSLKFPRDISVETSNNLYVDVLFECGIVGFFLLIIFLRFLYRKVRRIKDEQMRIFGILIFFDIVISSFFRADYATFRFFFLLFLLSVLIYGRGYLSKDKVLYS